MAKKIQEEQNEALRVPSGVTTPHLGVGYS
jgi:hypothetical protein